MHACAWFCRACPRPLRGVLRGRGARHPFTKLPRRFTKLTNTLLLHPQLPPLPALSAFLNNAPHQVQTL